MNYKVAFAVTALLLLIAVAAIAQENGKQDSMESEAQESGDSKEMPSMEQMQEWGPEKTVEEYAEFSLEERRSSAVDYIGAVVIAAEDPDAVAEFYRDAVGIPLTSMGGMWHCAVGNTAGVGTEFCRFAVYSKDFVPDFKAGGSVATVLHVKDFAASIAMAEEWGVTDITYMEDPEGMFAIFKDPEGNPVTLWSESGALPESAELYEMDM